MRNLLKTKNFWLAAAAVILAGGICVQEAMAYFTTHVEAQGGYLVSLADEKTVIEEEVKDMTKHITISNNGNADCYVRVKVFSGSRVSISYSGGAKWSRGEEGFWYYSDILPAGKETDTLQAKINVPADFTDSFDIIVIQECTPVLYDTQGAAYADWERVVDRTTDIGTVAREEDKAK